MDKVIGDVLSKILNLDLSKVSIPFSEVRHYSFAPNAVEMDKYVVIGQSFLNMLATYIAVSQPGLPDQRLDVFSKIVKKRVEQEIYCRAVKYGFHELVKYGSGVSSEERVEWGVLKPMILIGIGGVLKSIPLRDAMEGVSRLIVGTRLPSSSDPKTSLQELLQKRGLGLPSYSVISTEGLAHNLEFEAVCTVSTGARGIGRGGSKKVAEQNAATAVLGEFKEDGEERGVLVHPLDPNIHKKYALKRSYSPVQLCEMFGLPGDIDLLPCFVSPRLKGCSWYGKYTHRRLAMLGAGVLEYMVSEFAYLKSSDDSSAVRVLKAEMGRSVLFGPQLLNSVVRSYRRFFPEFVKLDSVGGGESYAIDCLQSLYAVSFLYYSNSGSLDGFFSSDATLFLKRRAMAVKPRASEVNRNDTSVSVERYSKMGFVCAFRRALSKQLSVYITHLRSGNSFSVLVKLEKESGKFDRLGCSRELLLVMDASEGLLPEGRINKEVLAEYHGLSDYIFETLVADRKSTATDEQRLKIESFCEQGLGSWEGANISELLDAWQNRSELSVVDAAEVLARLRALIGVDKELRKIRDFCYFPIIFDEKFSPELQSPIVDYSAANNMQSVDISTGMSVESFQLGGGAQSKAKSVGSEGKYSDAVRDGEFFGGTLFDLKGYEEVVSAMSLEELESVWMHKEMLESSEQAAVLLSFLRYEKGIDYVRQSPSHLLGSILIESLGLPSSSVSNSGGGSLDGNKREDFLVDATDTRPVQFVQKRVRVGQRQFREALIERNGILCSVTGCSISSILEAAHIAPYRGEKDNDMRNGLLLRVDIHRLFDANLIGISPSDLTICVSDKIKDSEYRCYDGRALNLSAEAKISPSALIYRWGYFLGKR